MKKGKLGQKYIYLDHAAATPMDARVERAMAPYARQEYANPSAIHAGGVRARRAIENARKTVAGFLRCGASEIVFVPGGTAGNNLAVLGVARAYKNNAPNPPLNLRGGSGGVIHTHAHIIVSSIEHESVLEPARQLEREGFVVTYVKVGKDGIVNPADVKKALRPETILVSIMYANNEIGTIQPIREIAKVIRDYKKERIATLSLSASWRIGTPRNDKFSKNSTPYTLHPLPYFHTDACQAANYLDLDVQKLGVDLMTLNGSKIYGPKMSGALFVRKGVNIEPVIFGGGQEKGLWSGTENVGGIVGFAKALEIAQELRVRESMRLTKLRDYFIEKLQKNIRGVTLNGDAVKRLQNNVHVSLNGIDGEAAVLYLDARGIQAAVGSACTSRSAEPSHVLKAIGLSEKMAHSSVRFTLGRGTTKTDCDTVVCALQEIRSMLQG